MVQKKGHISMGKHHLFGLVTVVCVLSALWCQAFVSLADSTGTVNVESAVIREKADKNSEVVGSAVHGNTVTIKGETQDSSGTLWYEVIVDGNTTGYIRSDLVDKQGDSSETSQTASNDTGGQDTAQSSAPGAMIAPDTAMDAQYATVSADSINVRATPSANDSAVGKLVKDTQVIVSGQSDGSDGKVWYYVIFSGSDGTDKSGYIRSDLLSLGDMVPVPEEETPEPQETEPEPEAPVNNDYELICVSSDDGTDVWYLCDNETDLKYPVDQLMEATKQRSENDAADAKMLVRQRIVIVVLVVLLVILIVAVVVMALKLRDVYYEDYEDEEEEEEEEEPTAQRRRRAEEDEAPTQRRRRTEEDEAPTQRRRRTEGDEAPTQRRRRTEGDEAPTQRRRRTEDDEASSQRRRRTDEDSSARRRRRMEEEDDADSASAAPKRKSKNFLLDDDEFEFEFLNMDDKDL